MIHKPIYYVELNIRNLLKRWDAGDNHTQGKIFQ